MVQLDVDSEVNHVVGPVREMAQNSSSPVFIGGAPGQSPPVYVCLLSMILSVWMILETNSEFLLRIFQANIKFVLVMMYSNYI